MPSREADRRVNRLEASGELRQERPPERGRYDAAARPLEHGTTELRLAFQDELADGADRYAQFASRATQRAKPRRGLHRPQAIQPDMQVLHQVFLYDPASKLH